MSVLNDGQCLCGNKFAVAESLALQKENVRANGTNILKWLEGGTLALSVLLRIKFLGHVHMVTKLQPLMVQYMTICTLNIKRKENSFKNLPITAWYQGGDTTDRYINWVCRIVFLCYLELNFKVNQTETLA